MDDFVRNIKGLFGKMPPPPDIIAGIWRIKSPKRAVYYSGKKIVDSDVKLRI